MAENNSGNGAAAQQSSEPAAAEPSVRDFLDFDPFEPPSGGQEGRQAPTPADGTEKAGDALPPEGQTQPNQGAQAPEAAKPPDPVLQELSRINQTLAANQQQQYYQQPGAQAPPQAAKPRYNLEIPQQVLKAVIHSEDPEERAIGLAALVNGLANTIYNDMSREFQAQQAQMAQAIPQMHARLSQEQNEQQRAAQDFFGRFQNLRPTPQMMQFVAGEAKQLAVELWNAGHRNLSWDENFREALGQRIHAGLGLPFPQRGVQPPPSAPNGRTPKRPQFASGGDAKGSDGRAAPNAEVKEIWDVFGYNT